MFEVFQQLFEGLQQGEVDAVLIAIWFALTPICLRSLYLQIDIDRWPSTQGTLLNLQRVDAGTHAELPPGQRYERNEANYVYTVDGVEYIGHEISPWKMQASGSLATVLSWQARGLVGEDGSVTVYYNPNKPHKAYLRRSNLLGKLFTLAIAALTFSAPFLRYG